jgi:hypothetical protein
MSRPRQPAPPPLEGPDQLVAAVITAGWAVAQIVLLAVRAELPGRDRWWVWVPVAGLLVGLFALWYMPRLKRSRASAAERRAAARAAAGPAGPAGEQAGAGPAAAS